MTSGVTGLSGGGGIARRTHDVVGEAVVALGIVVVEDHEEEVEPGRRQAAGPGRQGEGTRGGARRAGLHPRGGGGLDGFGARKRGSEGGC